MQCMKHSRTYHPMPPSVRDYPRHITVPVTPEPPPVSQSIRLDDLPSIQQFQKITVTAKVVYVNPPVTVTGGKRKQDFILADTTATTRLTLWEDKIDSLTLGKSYRLTNAVVRTWSNSTYLSLPREGSSIEQVPDIGDVADFDSEEEQIQELRSPIIIAVPLFNTYKSCVSCKARVESTTPPLRRCSRCSILQRVD